MNREHAPSVTGDALNFSGPIPILSPGRSLAPSSDESFQQLLLRLADKAGAAADSNSLIRLFCQSTREHFHLSTVCFWRNLPEGELLGEFADGASADRVIAARLDKGKSAVVADALRRRRVSFINQLQRENDPFFAECGVASLLAVPIVALNEAIGVVTFAHDNEDFFNEDLAAKATILAGQLGSLLEATRLNETAREEHRRAEILADVAHALHGTPDASAVIEALADRVRLLLRTKLVCVLLKREGPFELRAVSAETPQLANLARSRHDRQTLRFAANLAQRAVTAGEPVTLSIGAEVHSLGNLTSAGMLIAAPFRTSRTQGAILVYPRQDGVFTSEERTLVSAIAGFGAVAMAHAELYATAHAQAHELHQLLEISSALSSSRDLDHFLEGFVVHAVDFLGYGRCFIALLENDRFQLRYGVEKGEARRVETAIPEGVLTQALRTKEVFSTDDCGRVPGINVEALEKYHLKQLLAVPLLGTHGRLLGMFGVLDRLDGSGISREDHRRARALANQAAVVLEVANNLHLSEQHRRRAEALIEIAREIDGSLLLPEFSGRFLRRTADLTNSKCGLLAIVQDGRWQVAASHPHPEASTAIPATDAASSAPEAKSADTSSADSSAANPDPSSDRKSPAGRERNLPSSFGESVARHESLVVSGSAEELIGAETASALQWNSCILPGFHQRPVEGRQQQ